MVIKDANSEDDLFAEYEQKTGDTSYSEEKDKVIKIVGISQYTQNNPIPYNVMNNKHTKSIDTQTRHTKKSEASNAESKHKTTSQYVEKPKYCSNCGSKLTNRKANFCSQCGKKIIK